MEFITHSFVSHIVFIVFSCFSE
jgi:protein phosphatase 1L